MVFLACRRDLSSRAVAEAAWGSGDAHVQSTATRQPRSRAFEAPRAPRLILWLRLEAKPERALGPGATVGVLGTGVPRLACLWPAAWLEWWPSTAHLHQLELKTLARGQASRGGRCKTSSRAASPGRLTRGGEIKARQTSRGSRDVSHDDRHQAGASVQCPCFLFGAKGASAGAEY